MSAFSQAHVHTNAQAFLEALDNEEDHVTEVEPPIFLSEWKRMIRSTPLSLLTCVWEWYAGSTPPEQLSALREDMEKWEKSLTQFERMYVQGWFDRCCLRGFLETE
eukprot:CAMPEP_0113903320 /NCGR_PEP_ID=MMETSP0780_2-20120614/22448_1 /TAXON_ID=652834 /ORGANISM="Palpitomonas bilix" /LENGTH=105 /DNA_ID=CAMNT_0000896439 /DNA_START=194 /DNA_END=508 /DNA_ORIENTATION=- /assembly_acc=CAM_ASM_000599